MRKDSRLIYWPFPIIHLFYLLIHPFFHEQAPTHVRIIPFMIAIPWPNATATSPAISNANALPVMSMSVPTEHGCLEENAKKVLQGRGIWWATHFLQFISFPQIGKTDSVNLQVSC
jgi:hypothetical protein